VYVVLSSCEKLAPTQNKSFYRGEINTGPFDNLFLDNFGALIIKYSPLDPIRVSSQTKDFALIQSFTKNNIFSHNSFVTDLVFINFKGL